MADDSWVSPAPDGETVLPMVEYPVPPAEPGPSSLYDPLAPPYTVYTAPGSVVAGSSTPPGSTPTPAAAGGSAPGAAFQGSPSASGAAVDLPSISAAGVNLAPADPFSGTSAALSANPNAGILVGGHPVYIDQPISNSNFLAIGQALGAGPGSAAAAEQLQAFAGLIRDVANNTVSTGDLVNIVRAHTQLQFIDQNDVTIGGAPFHAASPGDALPTAATFALANTPTTPADWGAAINAALADGPVLAGHPTGLVATLTDLAALQPAGSAAQIGLTHIAGDIAYGSYLTANAQPTSGATPIPHWGAL